MFKIFFYYCMAVATVLSASEPLSLSQHVTNVSPSVVKIKVQRSDDSNDESELIAVEGGGSGFVFDTHHHVITNAHVIGNAKKIIVIDQNNTEYPAILIGKDDKSDIAVLEAAAFNTANAPFGDSRLLSAGDGVFVIGAPFSLGYSVSAGIVSAMKRFLPNYPYLHFIQTDSAINPGNSGGPMFNMNGQLIGMTSTHFTRQGGYTNIGFALPIEEVNRVVQLLLAKGKVERGYLGAELFISEIISRKMGYQFSVLVTRIGANSPAETSGLKTGDLIIGVNNGSLKDGGELHRILEKSQPDDPIALTYLRNKQAVTATVRLGKTPISKKDIDNIATADKAEKLGLILHENENEVSVTLSYGTAKTLGIDSLDIIVGISGTATKTIKELNTQLENIKEGEIVFLTLKRNGTLITVPIGSKTAMKGYTTQN